MLKNRDDLRPALTDAEIHLRIDRLREQMETQQMLIKERKLPVLVLIEGWGAAGKGYLINRIIRNLDPRFFSVVAMGESPSPEEARRPFLYRYFNVIPEAGQMALLDSGWMRQTLQEKLLHALSEKSYAQRLQSVRSFERQLSDNGYLVLKLFLNISQKEQKKRLDKLRKNPDTAWRVDAYDLWQNEHYDACLDAYDAYLTQTDLPNAPWYIIDGGERRQAELQVLEILTSAIDTALQNAGVAAPLLQNTFALTQMPKLAEVDLQKGLSKEAYQKQLKEAQKELEAFHNVLYRKRIPLIVVYEGWDAAGKGGNIRRVTEALDPRGYEVSPIASPQPHEKNRHYLWRFWTKLPKTGHIAIFDRSWYGRVMVERIEGFCSQNDWQRAYHEINEFEQELVNWGAIVVKFWVHIDQQTQLMRFQERERTPQKQWKITEEDWRNREKWPAYETAVDEMLQRTSTAFAPWHIIEGNDKRYARVKALRLLNQTIRKRLE